MKKDDCTEQEQWVLDQVKEGKFADLKNQFGEGEEKRRLGAKFLEALLTDEIIEGNDKYKPHRKGIRIGQAVLAETLDLENGEIEHFVVLAHIVVQGKVILKGSHFHRILDLNGSSFHQEANFNGLRADAGLLCQEVYFHGPVDLIGANIEGQFNAEKAQFQGQGPDNKAKFNGMKVAADIILDGAEFHGPVDFIGIQLKGTFSATPFIANDTEPKPTKFHDQAVFGGAHIDGQFQAQGVQFLHSVNTVDFDGLTVGRSAILSGAVFKGPVKFSQSNIGDNFVADGVCFENIAPGASFNGLKVAQLASFKGATFCGPAYFDLMRVEGIFTIKPMEVKMEHPRPTIFQGSAFFGGASIGSQFQADAARFYEQARFDAMKVEQDASFKGTIFAGRVHICFAHLLDLVFEGNPAIAELFLENTRIGRKLEISQTTIQMFQGKSLEVKGPATLRQVTISGGVDLQDSSFQVLNLRDVTWPENPEDFLLEGLTYQAVSAGEGKDDWKKLLAWIEGSRFNTQNYSQLEAYLTRCGHRDRADEVFITGKRQAANRLTWWKRWPTRLFWGGLAGYGRKPYLTLPWIIFFIAIGALVFSLDFTSKGMESQPYLKQMVADYPVFAKIILSLDRFLPGVDLGVAKHWAPIHVCFFSLIYWYLQKILGWILIPIALAAIYTRIK